MQFARSSGYFAVDHGGFALIAHADQKASTELEIQLYPLRQR